MEKQKQIKESTSPGKATKRIAMVRIRGDVHMWKEIKDTLRHLNLEVVNNCAVIDDRGEYTGMITKVKDYITWGEIDAKTFNKLLKKRGSINKDSKFDDKYVKENTKYASIDEFADAFMNLKAEIKDIPNLKKNFRLSPPLKGHARGGIKMPVTLGGAIGYRGKKINELLERMI
jgi:large subunit ribosomal protein L30